MAESMWAAADPEQTVDLVAIVIDCFRAELPEEEPVDVDTDFFEAGGNSVRAARVVARLRQKLGTPVSMRDVFYGRTPGAVAARLSGATPPDGPTTYVTAGNDG